MIFPSLSPLAERVCTAESRKKRLRSENRSRRGDPQGCAILGTPAPKCAIAPRDEGQALIIAGPGPVFRQLLPPSRFDGVFANASLFHVPSQELPRILLELRETLRPRGVLFCSNPRGNNEEGFSDGRYSCFFDLDTWRNYVRAAGFFEVGHYYRPPGLPRQQQPWLATVWRKATLP